MARRIEADDEVRRFNAVYLGPPGYSLPFHARYSAYAVGAAIFAVILLIEAITPLSVGLPPIWEGVFTVLGTSVVMSAVDHDKPLGPVVRSAVNVARAPRPRPERITRTRPRAGYIKITKDPIHEASSDR